jgi:hypothetical protein
MTTWESTETVHRILMPAKHLVDYLVKTRIREEMLFLQEGEIKVSKTLGQQWMAPQIMG